MNFNELSNMTAKAIFPSNSKELLYSIILQAKKRGYSFKNFLDDYDAFSITSFNEETGRLVLVLKNRAKLQLIYDSIYLLFFDVTFAKAIFGASWESNLVELAKTDDKIQYLADHLNLNDYECITG